MENDKLMMKYIIIWFEYRSNLSQKDYEMLTEMKNIKTGGK